MSSQVLIFVDVRDAASKSLSELLGVTQLTKASILLDYIIPAIEQGQCTTGETTDTVLSVLQHLKSYMLVFILLV